MLVPAGQYLCYDKYQRLQLHLTTYCSSKINLPHQTSSMMLQIILFHQRIEVRMVEVKPGIAIIEYENDVLATLQANLREPNVDYLCKQVANSQSFLLHLY